MKTFGFPRWFVAIGVLLAIMIGVSANLHAATLVLESGTEASYTYAYDPAADPNADYYGYLPQVHSDQGSTTPSGVSAATMGGEACLALQYPAQGAYSGIKSSLKNAGPEYGGGDVAKTMDRWHEAHGRVGL